MPNVVPFSAGGYRFLTARLPVFGRGRGRARLPHRAGAFREGAAARRGVRRDRGASGAARPAADGVLRLRIALAGAVHRCRLHRVQPPLRAAAGGLGHLPRRRQPGGALECLPRDRPAGRRPPSTPSATPCRATRAAPAALSAPAAARPARAAAAMPSASSGSATSRPRAMRDKAHFVMGVMEQRMAAARLRLARCHRDAGLHGV